MVGSVTDLLAWVVVAAFGMSALLEWYADGSAFDATVSGDSLDTGLESGQRLRDPVTLARGTAAIAWIVFAVFWLLLAPYYAFEARSYVEGILSIVAVPACLYTAYLVWAQRQSLLIFSRAIAVMGAIYLPFQTSPELSGATIEMVTVHAEWLMEALGYAPRVQTGEDGLRSIFVFGAPADPGHDLRTPVLLACSGIGSIAIVSGLIVSVDGPLRTKLASLAVVVPLIYVLNLVRIVFIVLAFSEQWFASFDWLAAMLFGVEQTYLGSYYIADRVIAQLASVVALLCITWGLLHVLPQLTVFVEEVAYLLTGEEYDIAEEFEIGRQQPEQSAD